MVSICGYRRGRTPARTSGASRWRSRTRTPSRMLPTRSRSASAPASVEPRKRNRMFSHASVASRRRDTSPALYAARPNWNADEPAMSVRSRSKNAAPGSSGRRSAAPPGGGGRMWGRSVTRWSWIRSSDLDDHGVALAAARADRRAAVAAAAAAQLVHERGEDPRARGADRVADGDRAAVDIHALLVDAEHPDRVQRHGGERLVDLPQVDVAGLQARLLERQLGRVGGRAREVGELVGDGRLGDDRGEDLLALPLGPLVRGDDDRARPVVDPRGVAGRVGALLAVQAGQLGQRLERRAAARCLVDLDDGVALATLDRHGDDLLGQPAVVRGLQRALVRAQRPAVHVRARDLELVADLRRL